MSALRTFALAAVAAAALAGSAQAQSTTPGNSPVAGQRGRGHGRGDQMGGFRELNLTDAQKAQIKTIHQKYEPQMKASRDQAKPFLDAARAARQKGDTATARANMEKAMQASSGIRQQEMNEVRGVLTAEQRTKFDAAASQRKQGGSRGMRGGRGPGARGQGGPRGAPFADLNLTEAQKTQMKAIRAKYQGQANSTRQQQMNEIRGILTPDQRTKLDVSIKARGARGDRAGFRGQRKAKG
jgi:Spy/CpxP family protein refolding chaperone